MQRLTKKQMDILSKTQDLFVKAFCKYHNTSTNKILIDVPNCDALYFPDEEDAFCNFHQTIDEYKAFLSDEDQDLLKEYLYNFHKKSFEKEINKNNIKKKMFPQIHSKLEPISDHFTRTLPIEEKLYLLTAIKRLGSSGNETDEKIGNMFNEIIRHKNNAQPLPDSQHSTVCNVLELSDCTIKANSQFSNALIEANNQFSKEDLPPTYNQLKLSEMSEDIYI